MKNELIDTDDRIIDALLTQRGKVDKDVLMEFARWCALQAAGLWDAPEAVIKYLETGNDSLREAAHQAAVRAYPKATEVATLAVDAAMKATDDVMSPEYIAYYASLYAAKAIWWMGEWGKRNWNAIRAEQEKELTNLMRSNMETNSKLNLYKRLAHEFFTRPIYRNQRVTLYSDPLTGEVEAFLPSEIPASGWQYLCTLIDPYIEWGQEACADETELEDAFSAWLDREFDAWFDSLISAIES